MERQFRTYEKPRGNNVKELRRPIFSISIASSLSGVSVGTIRRWEVAGIVTPVRRGRGWRMYSWEDIHTLRQARQLVRQGLRAREVRRRLRGRRAPARIILERILRSVDRPAVDRAAVRRPAVLVLPVLEGI